MFVHRLQDLQSLSMGLKTHHDPFQMQMQSIGTINLRSGADIPDPKIPNAGATKGEMWFLGQNKMSFEFWKLSYESSIYIECNWAVIAIICSQT